MKDHDNLHIPRWGTWIADSRTNIRCFADLRTENADSRSELLICAQVTQNTNTLSLNLVQMTAK